MKYDILLKNGWTVVEDSSMEMHTIASLLNTQKFVIIGNTIINPDSVFSITKVENND